MNRINVKSGVKEKCELIVIIFNKELYKYLKKKLVEEEKKELTISEFKEENNSDMTETI